MVLWFNRAAIAPSKRLSFTSAAPDGKGKPLLEVLTTVEFAQPNGKTKLTRRASVSKLRPEGAPHIAGMNEGWKQSLDRLEEFAVKGRVSS